MAAALKTYYSSEKKILTPCFPHSMCIMIALLVVIVQARSNARARNTEDGVYQSVKVTEKKLFKYRHFFTFFFTNLVCFYFRRWTHDRTGVVLL